MDVMQLLLGITIGLIALSLIPMAFSVDPLDRAPLDNPRLVNAFGAPVFEHVNVNQQVQITADITNFQNSSQELVFIVQVKDSNDVIVSLGWISGIILSPTQSLSPALSWTPNSAGSFTVEIFAWESLSNQDALSKPVSIRIITS